MTITVPGLTTITGRPETILRLLEETQVWDAAAGDTYIEKIQEAVSRAFEIHLDVNGSTYAERAASLLKELAKHDLITIERNEEE